MSFKDLGLNEVVLSALKPLGYENPTPIQEQAIPLVLEGKDILGSAQTGTGKTAAFSLPIVHTLASRPSKTQGRSKPIRALVLTPTRELASQIDENVRNYCKNSNLRSTVVFGGIPQRRQVDALRRGVDILIATPGRLLDLCNQGHIRLQDVEFLVLDEADTMLDMGFIHDIKKIIAKLPEERWSLFFSATMSREVETLAKSMLVDPEHIAIAPEKPAVEKIEQSLMFLDKENKDALLAKLLADPAMARVIVFTKMKHMANRVCTKVDREGITAAAIHGNKSQAARTKALARFKAGDVRVLVATDIAARGIDVEGITHVVNYDLPDDTESYVHRIGRTGRMGRKGEAWSFVTREDEPQIAKISSTWNMAIPFVDAPPLPEGVKRDPIGKRDDWDEVSDIFGMVKIRLSIGKSDSTKRALADWITNQARIPDIVIGEISQSDDETEVEIHVEKVAYVFGVIKAREFNGISLSPIIVEA